MIDELHPGYYRESRGKKVFQVNEYRLSGGQTVYLVPNFVKETPDQWVRVDHTYLQQYAKG